MSGWWEVAALDVRYALRQLRASPAMAVAVVLTLALGIGAVATMYGLMSWLLLQPPPHVMEPDQVAKLFFHYDEPGKPRTTRSEWYACVYDRLRNQDRMLQHVAAYTTFDVSVGAGEDAARARATVVSARFWAALGSRASIGRVFADEETGRIAGARVVVVGHAFWQRRYGGDPAVIGRTLRVRGEPFQIIGVTPRGFRGVERDDVDLWLPLSAYTLSGRQWENDTDLSYVVRFKPGVSTEQVDAELSRTVSDIVDEDAGCERGATASSAARLSVTAGSLAAGLGGDLRLIPEARVAVWLVGVAIVLLGVACANVASLLLLRALRRRREIAVRLALGMSLRRLAVQLFIETAMLSALGAFAAVVVIAWGGAWMSRVLLPNLAAEPAATVGASMVALISACLVGTAFLASLAPVLQVRTDPLGALHGRAARTTTRRGRLLGSLLVAQTAFSVVLLSGAGLFLRSMHNIRSLDLGLDPDNVLVATVDFVGSSRGAREVAAFYERALDRVQALPGVERAGLAMFIPLRSARAGSIRPAGRAEPLTSPVGDATYVNFVTPGFFAAVGTRIVAGRDFLPYERDGASVVVVNEATARAGWPGRSPIGECVEVDGSGPCATVVGVVENARRFFLREPPALLFYRPLPRDADDRARALFVRVAPGGRDMNANLARAVQALEPGLPFVRVQALGDALDRQIRPFRLGASVFTAFGVLAALLAALGLYGTLSYAVLQRRREIGVRVAVGARTQDVVRLIIRDALGLALAGILAGTTITFVGGRWIASLLFEVSPHDPAVFLAVSASLLSTALLAALVPSFRATRVDPVVALRSE